MTDSGKVAVLEWRSWRWSLFPHIVGEERLYVGVDPFRPFPEDEFERICQSASIVCFHLDLSFTRNLPMGIAELDRKFTDRGLYVVNGGVRDIRKSTLHRHLESLGLPSAKASRDGPPDEALFIKTTLNHGGAKEKSVNADDLPGEDFSGYISESIDQRTYRNLPRKEVADSIWDDPALVVERHITNPENSFYRVYFCGQQVIITKAFAPGVIKKLSGDPRDTNYVSELDFLLDGTDGLPISAKLKSEVATFVKGSPIEFGCLDIVHDGNENFCVIDLNLTPSAGENETDEELNQFLRHGFATPSHRKPRPAESTVLD